MAEKKDKGNILPDSFIMSKKKSSPRAHTADQTLDFSLEIKEGDIIGHYRIEGELGQGWMGQVFRAQDLKLKRIVAIKGLQEEGEDYKKRFKREYCFLNAIEHPNLVRAYDYFTYNNKTFMVLEYVEGLTLKRILQQHKLFLLEKLVIANKLARGIEILNTGGIIHRDIKPENIIVHNHGEIVKILDLGIGKQLYFDRENITMDGAILGTLEYLSPEQTDGRISERSDIFSLGILFYQLFSDSKQSPFYAGGDYETLYKIATWEPPNLYKQICYNCKKSGDVLSERERIAYSDIAKIVSKSLAKDPQLRWGSAGEMADHFEKIQKKFLQVGQVKNVDVAKPIDPLLMDKLKQLKTSFHEEDKDSKREQKNPLQKNQEDPLQKSQKDGVKIRRRRSQVYQQIEAREDFEQKQNLHKGILTLFVCSILLNLCAFWLLHRSWKREEQLLKQVKNLSATPEEQQAKQRVNSKKMPSNQGQIKGFRYTRSKTYSAGGKKHTVKEYIHLKTGIEFVLIAGGTFTMGSYRGDPDESPTRRVTLSPFLISKCEITQEQWITVMNNNPSKFIADNKPVEGVSWEEAREFCNKCNLNLPTEAQWEYACRAGTTTRYYWGDDWDKKKINSSSHWADRDLITHEQWQSFKFDQKWRLLGAGTLRVGSFPPNAFGLYDMLGNVLEWTEDRYEKYPRGAVEDPIAVSANMARVPRGGSWFYMAWFCRSANRVGFSPSFKSSFLGFRVAKFLQ